jgi:DNA-binding GntR family transcriptional regulator
VRATESNVPAKPAGSSDGLAAQALILRVGGGTSLTRQVLEAMVTAIQRGAFPSGRLPPEDELARQLGVSRTTVRRALHSMEQIGLIERRPGRGTKLRVHARPDLLALHGLVPFPTLLRELGHEVASHVTWRASDVVPPELAVRLGRETEGGSYELDVLLLADGQPAVRMLERFPADVLATTPSDQDLQAGSILFISERCFADPIDHALATLEPCVVRDNGEDEGGIALKLEAGCPYLTLHEIFFSADEVPLAISEVSVNPRFVTFSVFRNFL